MNTAAELRGALAHCYGTDTWTRHWSVKNFLHTDGVATFLENAGGGAYWFLDIVATEIFPLRHKEEFIAIELRVPGHNGNGALIEATDGNEKVIFTKDIDYTDCPEGSWKFFLTNDVMLLPSEY